MTAYQLAGLVERMRAAQSRYFRTRLQPDLHKSIELEHEVDQAVKDTLRAPSLFDRVLQKDDDAKGADR